MTGERPQDRPARRSGKQLEDLLSDGAIDGVSATVLLPKGSRLLVLLGQARELTAL